MCDTSLKENILVIIKTDNTPKNKKTPIHIDMSTQKKHLLK